MKLITVNQLRFAGVLFFLTILFRYALSSLLSMNHFTAIWFLAGIYAVVVFFIGWFFGKKDHESLPIYDIGFRFHLTTYIICNAIAELWHLYGFHSQFENIRYVHITALIWGVFIILHFVLFLATRREAIRGINKSEIFD